MTDHRSRVHQQADMSLIAEKGKARKAYEVARELKVETPTVLEFLASRGWDTSRKQMQPVDEDMYVELLRKFDKARLQKYQGEQTLVRGDDSKRDAARLREAEIEMLKAVGEHAPVAPPRKIELPKGQALKVVEKAPAPALESPAKKPAALPKGEAEAIREGELQPTIEPVAEAPPEPAAPSRRKIELPKGPALKIIERAPAPPPRPAPKPQPSAKPQPPALALPISLLGGPPQPAKKRLKRKKLAITVETPEDAIETAVEAQIRKDGGKAPKAKAAVKPAERGTGAVRRRRKKKGASEVAAPATAEAGRGARTGRRQRVVDQTEVTASIKKTMALMDGAGRRRHHYARSAAGDTEELIVEARLRVTEFLTTLELANMMEVPVQDVIRRCLEMGMIVSINQRLDRDVVVLLAAEFGAEVEFVSDEEISIEEEQARPENLVPRQPIVTVMGHVDHGKTTLLDHLRRTRVAEKEFGGITQHIGAYEVILNDQRITFLDTPGHEAFTAMRARGAQLTDLVVLVVACDDRVMPQTLEAIDHARAAAVPIVVAVNKIDKPNANPDAIYKQLADANLLVEKWGGKYQSAEISAKFGNGIDELLQEIVAAAELLDLKADPRQPARGVVIESRLDRGLGVVATVLVQNGTLKVGDAIVAGQHNGRVRALYNEGGDVWQDAGPARPVQVIGFSGVPQAGDKVVVYPNEKEAREVSLRRQQQQREVSMRQIRSFSLEQMSKKMKERELKELPLVIKGDVHGSVEVLADALMKLTTGEVKVNIIHRGVGAVTESDVLLGAASGAIVIGFHVHPNPQARELAQQQDVEIRAYRLIHEVVDDIRRAMEGLLAPTIEERVVGQVEIRKVFKISRIGSVAGCYVLEGKITRNSKVRLLRDGVGLWSGELASLRRFKDDAREVAQGFECGLNLNGYNDIQIGDRVEALEIIEKSRKLEET